MTRLSSFKSKPWVDPFSYPRISANCHKNKVVKGHNVHVPGMSDIPYAALGLSEDLPQPPQKPGLLGKCCKPTAQCHAYVAWLTDMNGRAEWQTEVDMEEANAYVDCCTRQYMASCDKPMIGNEIIWKDPSEGCSPSADAGLAASIAGVLH
jgi:hypothetical protein